MSEQQTPGAESANHGPIGLWSDFTGCFRENPRIPGGQLHLLVDRKNWPPATRVAIAEERDAPAFAYTYCGSAVYLQGDGDEVPVPRTERDYLHADGCYACLAAAKAPEPTGARFYAATLAAFIEQEDAEHTYLRETPPDDFGQRVAVNVVESADGDFAGIVLHGAPNDEPILSERNVSDIEIDRETAAMLLAAFHRLWPDLEPADLDAYRMKGGV